MSNFSVDKDGYLEIEFVMHSPYEMMMDRYLEDLNKYFRLSYIKECRRHIVSFLSGEEFTSSKKIHLYCRYCEEEIFNSETHYFDSNTRVINKKALCSKCSRSNQSQSMKSRRKSC